jgi:hypothetical protein
VVDFALKKMLHSKKILLNNMSKSVDVTVAAVRGRVNEASFWNVQSFKLWSHSVAWHKTDEISCISGGRKLATHEVHMYIIG